MVSDFDITCSPWPQLHRNNLKKRPHNSQDFTVHIYLIAPCVFWKWILHSQSFRSTTTNKADRTALTLWKEHNRELALSNLAIKAFWQWISALLSAHLHISPSFSASATGGGERQRYRMCVGDWVGGNCDSVFTCGNPSHGWRQKDEWAE